MRLIELFEGVNASTLYHGTAWDSAEKIIYSDVLLDLTDHSVDLPYGRRRSSFKPAEINQFGRVKGISLTRNPMFARRWGSGEGIVLAFNANKIRHNFRLVPYDYYKNREEAEEYLIGPLKPVSRYLTAIMVSQTTYDQLEEANEDLLRVISLILKLPIILCCKL